MKLGKREITGREKDETSIQLLEELRQKLHTDNTSVARKAAFNLSWMQEDGLEILKEALFSRTTRRTKSAAAYGLRKMQGRMKKNALELFQQGLEHTTRDIANTCKTALSLMKRKTKKKSTSRRHYAERAKFKIREISNKTGQEQRAQKRRQNTRPSSR